MKKFIISVIAIAICTHILNVLTPEKVESFTESTVAVSEEQKSTMESAMNELKEVIGNLCSK